MYHEHPLRILRYSMKNMWLLIFPLIRGIYAGIGESELKGWLSGLWLDIAVIGLIIMFGLIMWYFSVVETGETLITHKSGVLLRTMRIIPYKNISTIKTEKPLFLRPFGAVRLICETSGGISAKGSIRLLANGKLYDEIMKNIQDAASEKTREKNPSPLAAVMLSAFFSSGFSGALYIGVLFFKGGDIAKGIISESIRIITDETAKLSENWIINIPAAATAAGGFFIAAWLFSFTANLLRYSCFVISCDSDRVCIECGLFTKRRFNINISHISYTDFRQSLIMKFLRIVTVNISCAGYGNNKRRLPVILPMKRINAENENKDNAVESELRPSWTGVWQYVWFPVVIFAVVLLLYLIWGRYSEYSQAAGFAAVMTEIPLIWLIIVKVTALLTSGIWLSDNKAVIKYSKGYSFHTITVNRCKLAELSIVQSPFQRIFSKCNLKFRAESKEQTVHIVKGLHFSDCMDIVHHLDRQKKASA